jgi:hypothetical protein
MVLKYSKDDQTTDIEENSPGDLERNELIAVIRQTSGESHEIVMNDDVVWTATPNGQNNFEFVNVKGGITTTAQWAKVKVKSKKSGTLVHIQKQHVICWDSFQCYDPTLTDI